MEERRCQPRAMMHFDARCIVGTSREYMDCEIINIGREGLAVLVYMQDVLPVGSMLELEIQVPSRVNSIACIVTIKWIKDLPDHEKYNFVVGGQIARIAPEDKDRLLSYAFHNVI